MRGRVPGSFAFTEGGLKLTGKALIKKLSFKGKTKDGFAMTASFVNKGPWTLPT